MTEIIEILVELTEAEDYRTCFEFEDIRNHFINSFLNKVVCKIIDQGTYSDNDVVDTANRLLFLFTELSIKVIEKGENTVFKGLKKVFDPDESWYEKNNQVLANCPVPLIIYNINHLSSLELKLKKHRNFLNFIRT